MVSLLVGRANIIFTNRGPSIGNVIIRQIIKIRVRISIDIGGRIKRCELMLELIGGWRAQEE